ncbi:MAG: hypothetical protein IT552_11750 [Sphingomonadaceae bacterium]|nr:hypothetical protein [Sphingomonadaceae bacterium]
MPRRKKPAGPFRYFKSSPEVTRLFEMRKFVPGVCPTNTTGFTGTLVAKLR